MPRLISIPDPAQPGAATPCHSAAGLAILQEIRHGLSRLVATGQGGLIDLGAIPLGPDEEARLLTLLGQGEVTAEIAALGPTRIWETGVPGVWVLDHRNLEGQRLALHIEIARIPKMLVTQPQDLEGATAALDARIATAQAPSPAGEDRASNAHGREPNNRPNEHTGALPPAALRPKHIVRDAPLTGCPAEDGARCRR